MKKIFFITIIFIQISFLNIPYSLAQNFAPLNLGNVWVWEHPQTGTTEKSTVVDSISINGNYFYKIRLYEGSNSFKYSRINFEDSLFYFYSPIDTLNNSEIPYYKLNCALGDTFSYIIAIVQQDTNIITVYKTFEVIDVYQTNVFDTLVNVKILHWNAGGLVEGIDIWTDEFGLLYSETWEFGDPSFLLRGCVINGIVYGDTAITVSVEDEPFTAFNFKLHQNYPNPFNPMTRIKFSIPKSEIVQLKIYDVLGNEIKTLLNDFKTSGTYEIEFDASDLPSSVYFYRMISGNYSETKKMILSQ